MANSHKSDTDHYNTTNLTPGIANKTIEITEDSEKTRTSGSAIYTRPVSSSFISDIKHIHEHASSICSTGQGLECETSCLNRDDIQPSHCCSPKSKMGLEREKDGGSALNNSEIDLECGPEILERVVLTVSGLKCGCCETGISKALRQYPAVANSQVNIVLARVEFDLDVSRSSVPAVISYLSKSTGYTYAVHEQPTGQILDLLVADPTDIHHAGRPYGVTLIESAEEKMSWSPTKILSTQGAMKTPTFGTPATSNSHYPARIIDQRTIGFPSLKTVRIHYDASRIGARDVFEYYQHLAPNQDIRLAQAEPSGSSAVGLEETKRAFSLFIVTLLMTIPVLVFAWSHTRGIIYDHLSLALATIVQAVALEEFVPSGLRTLVHSHLFNMDLLIALSTSMAYVFSVVSYAFLIAGRPLEIGSFFETSTLLTVLILLGRTISEFSRLKAARLVSVRSLQSNYALILEPGGPIGPTREVRQIDARLLQYCDIINVPPHTRIVTDGKVLYGGSEVDESMTTGETVPVAKGLGQYVRAGTINGTGQLIVAITKLPHENSISTIAKMVEDAEFTKPKIQVLADQVAEWFVPVISIIGIVVFLLWMFISHFHYHDDWQRSTMIAITYTIATLIVSCPCAIGLAVPMVVLIAGGVSARYGIIFRDPQKLEVARGITDVVFDKTGTLTSGTLQVIEATFHNDRSDLKAMISGLLENDKHPVARGVVSWLRDETWKDGHNRLYPVTMRDIKSAPGCGVMGVCELNNLEIRAGNPEWLGLSVLDNHDTQLCITIDGEHSATFRLRDTVRPNANSVIQRLLDRGLVVHMISGDGEGAVNDIAHTIGIPKSHTRWRTKPGDKKDYIHDIQCKGGVVLFCGDGTNDSVALKQADVGVHINQGSDVAKSAADVILMTARLYDILILLDLSQAAYTRIMLNFGWSFIYNILAVLMAAGAFVKFRIDPRWAGLGELVSVVPVIIIAFQLRWIDFAQEYRGMEWRQGDEN